ncbi:MAG TPA: choice-of-anchor R domain-containing protein [Rhizomicrobium sp.]|nr:choice-of-anchor R domain-containing protein [Rhizomicrobium sp.]
MKHIIIAAAALALLGTSATAAQQDLTVSKNKRTVSVSPGPAHYTVPLAPPKGLTVVFNNIGKKYPDGVYFCCDGLTIAGPDSIEGQTVWPAIAFTPAADVTVTRVDLALGYDDHGANDVAVSIAADSGGLPGTLLETVHVSNLPEFGDCCAITRAKFKGIKLSAGQQYWVVAGTDANDSTAFAAWALNTTEQIKTVRFAENIGTGWELVNANARPSPAFAVYGK